MEKKTIYRSLFSEYELGGCKKLEQVKKTKIVEIAVTIPKTFEVKKVERFKIKSIRSQKNKIKIYATKSIEQLSIKELLKVDEKRELVEELSERLQEDKVFMKTFFIQFTNKLYHIIQQKKDSELRMDR